MLSKAEKRSEGTSSFFTSVGFTADTCPLVIVSNGSAVELALIVGAEVNGANGSPPAAPPALPEGVENALNGSELAFPSDD